MSLARTDPLDTLPQQVDIVAVVYGKHYVESWCDLLLPNLNSILNEWPLEFYQRVTLNIYTTENEAPLLSAKTQSILPSFLTVQIYPLIHPSISGIYGGLNIAHHAAIRKAWSRNAAMIFLFPDSIYAQGFWGSLYHFLSKGIRCVISPSVRAASETTIVQLKQLHATSQDSKSFSLSPRQCVRIALDNLHPICQELMWEKWNKGGKNVYPYVIYHSPNPSTLFVKTLLGHVLLAWPEREVVEYKGTIEMEFLRRAFPDFKKIHVVRDSDELFVFDCAPALKFTSPAHGNTRSRQLLHSVMNRQLHTDYHLKTALVTSIIHSEDLPNDTANLVLAFDNDTNSFFWSALTLRWCRATIVKLKNYLLFIIGMLLEYLIHSFLTFSAFLRKW